MEQQVLHWVGKRFDFDLTDEPIIYSIINCTPDSFFDGNKYPDLAAVLTQVSQDLANGAQVIEIGGKSTRPNFQEIGATEELRRISPILKAVKQEFPQAIVAVDTTDSVVMRTVLSKFKVDIINDIKGFETTEKLSIIEQFQPSVVVMNNGRDTTNLLEDQMAFFKQKQTQLLQAGLTTAQIAIDPGVGFSTSHQVKENLLRVEMTKKLAKLNMPVMIAISQKGFLSKLFQVAEKERLIPTLILECLMIQDGGRILRVHNSRETKLLLDIMKCYKI
ncbi:dihydropteroate synthase [Companilactobacillus sp. FL22-1]|uniref:dihydropteroate synthase n=1 Tax=Companilactobacillus sp. FL22-1 TaxID=3373892 RepID=UPI003754EFBB